MILDPHPPYFQVHMKEVMSAVWLQGLDLSYLREQVTSEFIYLF